MAPKCQVGKVVIVSRAAHPFRLYVTEVDVGILQFAHVSITVEAVEMLAAREERVFAPAQFSLRTHFPISARMELVVNSPRTWARVSSDLLRLPGWLASPTAVKRAMKQA
jgi:hypothetical protein